MTINPDDKLFCAKCKGDGCNKCKGLGWKYADGVEPFECRKGVPCGRAFQCPECPNVEKLALVKEGTNAEA